MKRMEWLNLWCGLRRGLHIARMKNGDDQNQAIVYLGSEVDGLDLYNNYLVSCELGDIRLNVEFLGGGVYSTIVRCSTKITTTGTISKATLITSAGEEIGPLTPVAIGEPPESIKHSCRWWRDDEASGGVSSDQRRRSTRYRLRWRCFS